jgi:transposase
MVKKRLDEATQKRVLAGRLLLKGKKPAKVAVAVGVARQTIYTWKALLDEGGIDALRSAPSRGRPPRLDETKLEDLRRVLLQKPTEHGFGTELWTLKRVGVVIQRLYGVKFGQTQIWRVLGALGFSVQKPDRRAIERNEDTVRGWKRGTFPALKKKPSEKVV